LLLYVGLKNGTWFFKDDDGTTLLLSPAINFREVYLGKRFYLEFSLVSRKKIPITI